MSYHLPEGYNERLDNTLWEDFNEEEEWQREVYVLARDICLENGYTKVVDFGCGSAFKTLRYLGDFDIIGVDLQHVVDHLKWKYPDKKWTTSGEIPTADLVICADVLEHIPNPDVAMRCIQQINPKKIVISTPERGSRIDSPELGPPWHTGHCREWNMKEFKAYVEDWFRIERGPWIFPPQMVQQMVVCVPK